MNKRITAFLLLMAMLCTVSCGETPSTPVSDDTTVTDTVEVAAISDTDEYGREYVPSAISDDLDFGGTKVNFWCRNDSGFEYEFAVEDSVGEVMNDAVFNRNQLVEERLGIEFVFHTVSSDNSNIQTLRSSILSGTGAYDIAAIHCSQGAVLAPEGAYQNLLNFDILALDKPWWNQTLNEELDVFGYLPMICGDISLSATMRTNVTFFNKSLYDEYFDDNIYDIVKSGKWTLDTFKSMTKDVYRDLDGNSKMDNEDFYAIAFPSASTPLDAFVAALDLSITTTNIDGVPELSFNSERTINAFQKLTELVMENPGTWTNSRDDAAKAPDMIRPKFVNGEFIFWMTNIQETEKFRDMKDPYGVLPLPKFDESQDAYYTLPHNAFSMMTIPADSKNSEAAAAALEALCEESWRTVTPAYYEVALKAKYFHDDESAQMFDLIMEGIQLNFGSVYQTTCIDAIGWLIRDLSKDFASTYAANERKYEKALAKLLEDLEALSEE